AAGASGGAGATGNGGAGGADASADGMPACSSTPDCHCDYYGGHAYKFCGNGRGYADAAAACAMQGMRLIRVDDEGENQWAWSGKVSRGFPDTWIGADDTAVEGDWRWSDGASFWMGKAGAAGAGPVGALFNAWQTSPPQPDDANGNEDCAAYAYSNDRWADLPCTNHNAYVCELY
ncbi:MAG TPA: C-type lectin domain-containing protein, partial [Polyangia bacterium]|nr:C-type lectin domain-containing protein [Polyangia bacterium]